MSNVPLCPHCRQPVRHERVGIFLPPTKAAIFDALRRAGDNGLSLEELTAAIERKVARATVHTHLWQLNQIYLAEGDWRVVAEGRGRHACWYLRKRRRREVVE